jgi:hypothetical protein
MTDEVARIGALSRVERPETLSKVPRCFLPQPASVPTQRIGSPHQDPSRIPARLRRAAKRERVEWVKDLLRCRLAEAKNVVLT